VRCSPVKRKWEKGGCHWRRTGWLRDLLLSCGERRGCYPDLPEPAIEAKFWMFKKYFQDKLAKDNVKVYPHAQFKKITDKGVAIIAEDGTETFLDCDTVVLSTGSTPNDTLAKVLKGKYMEFAEIGIVSNPVKSAKPSRKLCGPPPQFN